MIRFFYGTFFILSVIILTSSCRKKEFDKYFARPDSLADPIYQQLQARKNFTNILACIDKAGFKQILGTSGYWTFFAPNDDAFKTYFQANGINSVQQIDSVKAAGIVTYCLVQNAYRKDQLSMYQTSKGPTVNDAYRRRTDYYDFTYKDAGHSGMAVANNRNGSYVANDNNNKYIPYFIDGYFSVNGLSSADYNAFYPNSTYTGFNVADAKVVNADIRAENGIIHEIDKVIEPIDNIEQYVTRNPQYSEFRKLLDRVAIYTANPTLTHRYNVLTGKTDSVFIKSYPTSLGFAPNNEGYLNASQTDAQELAWSIAVPDNDALIAWEKEILVNYNSFNNAPPTITTDLINSFMWNLTVWPKDVLTTSTVGGQNATFAKEDIEESKVLSNGNFYGTKVAQKANVFRTVYGKAYLDPKYSLMTRIFNESDLKVSTTNPALKYTVFMMSDNEVRALGYNYDTDHSQWSYLDPKTPTASPALSLTQDRLTRIAQLSVVNTPNGEFDNLSGEGIAEGYQGEYVKFKSNKVYAAGNILDGTSVTIDSSKTAFNGKVYYTKGLLHFSENTQTLGADIERLGLSTDPATAARFNYFYQFLINSSIYDSFSKGIVGAPVGAFYTVFIPTNAAIMQAVKDGLLPGDKTTGVPAFTAAKQTASQQVDVANFIQYHIVNKTTIAIDDKKSGLFPTLAVDGNGDPMLLQVFYNSNNFTVPGQVEVRDSHTTSSTGAAIVDYSGSNNLANRALIHSINKVLNFK